jgi:hypothetical protein
MPRLKRVDLEQSLAAFVAITMVRWSVGWTNTAFFLPQLTRTKPKRLMIDFDLVTKKEQGVRLSCKIQISTVCPLCRISEACLKLIYKRHVSYRVSEDIVSYAVRNCTM